ncbi:hypothetical protein ACN28S_48345 [Cystobacter fuscus]
MRKREWSVEWKPVPTADGRERMGALCSCSWTLPAARLEGPKGLQPRQAK